MEKKKNTGLIVILVILLLGTSGYIVYDKFLVSTNNDVKQEEVDDVAEEEEKFEVLEVTSDEVRKLYNRISSGLDYYCGIDVYYTDKKITPKDINNLLAYEIAVLQIHDERKSMGDAEIFERGDFFTAQDLELKIKKTFGKDYKFEHKTYTGTCPGFEYHEDTKKYISMAPGCGGTCGPINLKKIVKAIKIDNSIELYVRVLFVGEQIGNEIPYYEDYNKTKKVDGLELDSLNNFPRDTDANLAKGSLYKLVFTEEDGNYVFTSSELVK